MLPSLRHHPTWVMPQSLTWQSTRRSAYCASTSSRARHGLVNYPPFTRTRISRRIQFNGFSEQSLRGTALQPALPQTNSLPEATGWCSSTRLQFSVSI